MSGRRIHRVKRETRETRVVLSLNADGSGKCTCEVDGLQMLKHMLATLARYASFDLSVSAVGDMEHHISEDVAICLGIALKRCIEDASVKRIGSATVPMDDSLVLVSVDLSGRSYFATDDIMEPFGHFLSSLAANAAINLHVVVIRGTDHHHTVEASFKALGIALRQAIERRTGDLSVKGNVMLEVD
ncbi:MAG: imidazoleglycerol-phosphate dehydratase [Thermoplasmata archaeon]|uniref:Imidazoleglycerol-phosphate dehydratase n=1 Tax=Candidatus Sysuiplasma superficiale TaxID=2823368 RepID=A0A8J7YT37_9ARCH|nr:imidazoleglycerol-phosphate dehydratase [Candidatus Sysuiplasma superficiale]MBX8643607.1 imidazoleglycerol-phosphate dehydratase [Candidatus Sysuiplasma superficiale]MCL4347118.1 imidazoleglycerol-phosphate dehydratase [Candidatus Thermoplasmatota archaeon]MCL5437120.1 imidazoleglycerol-phosphate dehydratase [Candidatus Thermoplasmatota archaeon]